jgi:hypothetical protein
MKGRRMGEPRDWLNNPVLQAGLRGLAMTNPALAPLLAPAMTKGPPPAAPRKDRPGHEPASADRARRYREFLAQERRDATAAAGRGQPLYPKGVALGRDLDADSLRAVGLDREHLPAYSMSPDVMRRLARAEVRALGPAAFPRGRHDQFDLGRAIGGVRSADDAASVFEALHKARYGRLSAQRRDWEPAEEVFRPELDREGRIGVSPYRENVFDPKYWDDAQIDGREALATETEARPTAARPKRYRTFGGQRPQKFRVYDPVDTTGENLGMLVRMTDGEARGETLMGRRAVAASMINRAADRSRSIPDIAAEPDQYEPYAEIARDPIPEASERYRRALSDIAPVLEGYDPTDGATGFVNPFSEGYEDVWRPGRGPKKPRPRPRWFRQPELYVGRHEFHYSPLDDRPTTPATREARAPRRRPRDADQGIAWYLRR